MKKGIEVDLFNGDCVSICKEAGALVGVINFSTVRGDNNPEYVTKMKEVITRMHENSLVPMLCVDDLDLMSPSNLSLLRISASFAISCGAKGIIIKGKHKIDNKAEIQSEHRRFIANVFRVVKDVPTLIFIGATGDIDINRLYIEAAPFLKASRISIMTETINKQSASVCAMLDIPLSYSLNANSKNKEVLKSSLTGYSGYVIFSGNPMKTANRALKLETLLV